MPHIAWILAAGALVIAGWAGLRTLRDQPVIMKQLIGAGVLEAGLFIQTGISIAGIVGGHTVADPVKYWGYVISAALLFPAAGVWAIAERTRWSSVVLVVAAITFIVLQVRIVQIWGGA